MPREYEELPGTILTNLLAREFEEWVLDEKMKKN
jgi:hypothetical protein